MVDGRWQYVFGVMWDYEHIPDGVEIVEREELLMYKTNGSSSILSNKITRVEIESEDEFTNLLNEINMFYGAASHSWWVGPDSSPSHLADLLERNGYKQHDTYFGLVKKVSEIEAPDVPYEIRVVQNEHDVRKYIEVSSAIWGYDDASRETLVQQRLGYLRSEDCRGGFLLVMDRDQPVGYAGYRFSGDGEAMYLSGTGVLESYRGKGIYRALLARRVQLAREKGCHWIATQARKGTSEPILRRIGFEEIGMYNVFVTK